MEITKFGYKAGVVGIGSIGSRYVNWLSDLGCSVCAYDSDPQKIQKLSNNIKVCDSLDKFVKWGPSFVVIAAPPAHHLDVFEALAAENRHIIIEKPIASNIADAEKIQAISNRFQKKVHVVSNMRFHPAFEAIEQNVGFVGSQIFARAHFSHRLSQMRPNGTNVFASERECGGGVILDCVHDIDLMNYLFGPLDLVYSWQGQIGPDQISSEDYAEILCVSKSGVRIAMHFDFISRWKRRGIELVGSDGTILWTSEGRSPEMMTVSTLKNNHEDHIIKEYVQNPDKAYIKMLQSFLSDKKKLQTPNEAVSILRFALLASEQIQ